MRKLILICVLTHCLLSLTMARQQTDDHFNIPFSNHYYGCLDKKNVTVLVEIEKPDYLYEISKLLNYLDQPCYSLNVYLFNVRKFVPFDNSVGHLVQSDYPQKKRHKKETREIIDNLQRQNSTDATTDQILLFFQNREDLDREGYNAILKKLQNLDAQPNWNIIFVCNPGLCTLGFDPPFPINRIVPFWFSKSDLLPVRNHLRSLIDNPDFDRFEFLKQIEVVGDQRWNCLKNTTIGFADRYFTFKIMEDVVLLLQNTQDLNTHVRFKHEPSIWRYFIRYYKLHRLHSFIVHHDSNVLCISADGWSSNSCTQPYKGEKRAIIYVKNDSEKKKSSSFTENSVISFIALSSNNKT